MKTLFILFIILISGVSMGQEVKDAVFAAEEFNFSIKIADSAGREKYKSYLEEIPEDSLFAQLNTQGKVKAFWLNMYNGYIQYFLKENEELYQDRKAFFGKERIVIAGQRLSLDDIEHGIIRRSKVKLGMGYLNKCFPGKFEKRFRWEEVDYRIHFALNCGAKSCPPVAFYNHEKIEEELELATEGYLKNESDFKEEENEIWVPRLFSWFRGDFGGKKGMYEILWKFKIVPKGEKPKIKFLEYDWDLYLSNYSE
jgi:hypothetical protein